MSCWHWVRSELAMLINNALSLLEAELNVYLNHLTGAPEEGESKLELTAGFTTTGDPKFSNLGMLLVNIEEERVHKTQTPYRINSTGNPERLNPEIKLNLHVLFAANFSSDHSEALKFVGYVVEFFQGKTVFTRQNTPAMDPSIEKLVVELQTLTFEQQNHLWGTLGGKYMPSVLYKIRLLEVQRGAILGPVEKITEVQENSKML